MKVQRRDVEGALIIGAIALLVFLPAIRGGFIWDDDVLITDNATIHASDGLSKIWRGVGVPDYFPLTYSLFWLEWRLFELHAAGYHLVNVLLHAVGSVLLWRVFRKLSVPGAWLAALVFAVHPVAAASAGWISETKNTLSLVFYAAAALCFLHSEDRPQQRQWYVGSLGLFTLALLSKSSVVMLPIVLLGCVWWQRNRIVLSDVRRTSPLFALSMIFGVITIWFQTHHAGTVNFTEHPDFLARLAGAGQAIWFYVGKTLLPINLCAVYPTWPLNSSAIAFIPDLFLVLAAVVLWKLPKQWSRAAIFGFGYFAITLFPVLGFFDMYFFLFARVADHFQYLALPGIIALIVGGVVKWVETTLGTLDARIGRPQIAFAAVVVWCGIGAWHQAQLHGDVEALWRDAIEHNPQSWMAYGNLGGILADKHKPDEAMANYRRAIELNTNFANAHYELAGILASRGYVTEATFHFGEAARSKPSMVNAHYNHAFGLEQLGRTNEAIAEYVETTRIAPDYAPAFNNVGALYLKLHQLDLAEANLQRAIAIKADYGFAHCNYGDLLAELGRLSDAANEYRKALQTESNLLVCYNNLAKVLIKLGDTQGAFAPVTKCLQINSRYAPAHHTLGLLLAREGRPDDASAQFQEALSLDPNLGEAKAQLDAMASAK